MDSETATTLDGNKALPRAGEASLGEGPFVANGKGRTGERAPASRLIVLAGRANPWAIGTACLLAVSVLAFAVVGVAAFLGRPPKVVVASARPSLIHDQPGGVGFLEALPEDSFDVHLTAIGLRAAVPVDQVFVEPGSNVVPGSPLISLNPRPFVEDIQQVKLDLAQAEAALASTRGYNDSSSHRHAGYANPYLATKIPELAGQVEIDRQLLGIAEGNGSVLRSPITGKVLSVSTVPGAEINPGTPLMEIVNTSSVQVEAAVQLSDLAVVHPGERASVVPSEMPGLMLRGAVVATEPSATKSGLEGTVVLHVDNARSDPVPIGAQVFVTIFATEHAAVSVPDLAVLNRQLAPIVLVVRHGRVFPARVALGASDDNRTEILSGLRDGEQVVVSNMQSLRTGERVHVTHVVRG